MNAAEFAQNVRKQLLAMPEVSVVFGPSLGSPRQYFVRAVLKQGVAVAIELTWEDDHDAA